ncbi:MAG: hypothetical protein WCR29_06705, partial [Bacteroidales bacterium]
FSFPYAIILPYILLNTSSKKEGLATTVLVNPSSKSTDKKLDAERMEAIEKIVARHTKIKYRIIFIIYGFANIQLKLFLILL